MDFFFILKSHLELIKNQLDSLDVKKATGLDEISPQFLRDAAPIVCAPLADIFITRC